MYVWLDHICIYYIIYIYSCGSCRLCHVFHVFCICACALHTEHSLHGLRIRSFSCCIYGRHGMQLLDWWLLVACYLSTGQIGARFPSIWVHSLDSLEFATTCRFRSGESEEGCKNASFQGICSTSTGWEEVFCNADIRGAARVLWHLCEDPQMQWALNWFAVELVLARGLSRDPG